MSKGLVFAVCLVLLAAPAVYANLAECEADLNMMMSPAQWNITDQVNSMHRATGAGNYAFTMLGSNFDMGNWQACDELDGTRYCAVYQDVEVGMGALPAVGACVPHSCSESDLNTFSRTFLVSALDLPFQKVSPIGLHVDCPREISHEDLPVAGVITLSIICSLLAIVIVATAVDCQTEHDVFPLARTLGARVSRSDIYDIPYEGEEDEGLVDRNTREFSGIYGKASAIASSADEMAYLAGAPSDLPVNDVTDTYRIIRESRIFQLLLAFSAYTNTKKLLKPTPTSSTSALNGIRFLSICWVIFGHTYVLLLSTPIVNISTLHDVLQRFRFQITFAGFFAVDTFFLISGFLVAFLFLKELRSHGMRPITMPMFYFHRLWRLTPTLLMVIFVYWKVMPYTLSSGPLQEAQLTAVNTACDDSWWATLLYINNFWEPTKQCAAWAWYLANDMQFFALSPIFLIAYWKLPIAGIGLTLFFVGGSVLANIISALYYDLSAFGVLQFVAGTGTGISQKQMDDPVLSNIYMLPWTRCGVYFIGFLLAFALLEKPRLKIPVVYRYIIYSFAGILFFVLTFATYTNARWGWNEAQNVFWLGFARVSWGVAVSIMVWMCALGYGGMINSVFSHDIFVPLARISFGMYMYHLIGMTWFVTSFKAPIAYQPIMILFFYVGYVLVAILLSYINYLLLEKPLMNLESMALGSLRKRN